MLYYNSQLFFLTLTPKSENLSIFLFPAPKSISTSLNTF